MSSRSRWPSPWASRPGLQAFSKQTLPEVGLLVRDLRDMADALSGVAERLNRGGASSLTLPEGGTGSYAYNLAFFGKDVFVLGEAYVNGNYKAIVWKNGELFSPYDGTNNYSAYTMSVVAQQ